MSAARAVSAIPAALFLLAERYGQAIAAGTMLYADADATLSLACLHHRQIGPDRMDAALSRLLTTLARAAYADELQAAADIRQGIQSSLDRRAPTATLRAEAYRLSAARLLRPDCDAIVQEEIARRLNPGRKRA